MKVQLLTNMRALTKFILLLVRFKISTCTHTFIYVSQSTVMVTKNICIGFIEDFLQVL